MKKDICMRSEPRVWEERVEPIHGNSYPPGPAAGQAPRSPQQGPEHQEKTAIQTSGQGEGRLAVWTTRPTPAYGRHLSPQEDSPPLIQLLAALAGLAIRKAWVSSPTPPAPLPEVYNELFC